MSRKYSLTSAALVAVLALTTFGAAAGAHAQNGGGQGRGGGMMERYDADKDGKLSLAEYEAGRQNSFSRMDADANGTLSFAEIDAAVAQAAQRGGGMAQMMQQRMTALKAADANGDSAISADEYKAAADAEFKKMDTDSDGFVTADEMQAAMSH